MRPRTTFFAAAFASLLMAAVAFAQQGQDKPTLDTHFLKAAAVDNMFEIQLSQLAQQKAQDQKVKDFAQTMVQDHTKASTELKQLAQSKGVQIPQQLPELKQEELQIFQSLSGADFDQAYKSCMKVAHAKDVAKFEEKSKHAKDAEIKAWAAKTLPTLKEHKQHVLAMTGDKEDEGARTAGERSESDRQRDRDESGAGSKSGSSSGTGSRQGGSGTVTGGGTDAAGTGSK